MLSCFSRIQLLATQRTLTPQASLSIGFSGQEHWNGLPYSPPGDLPYPGIEPMFFMSPALAGGFFTTSPTWKCACLIWVKGKDRLFLSSHGPALREQM